MYEIFGSARLKNNGQFAMYTRNVWYGVEMKGEKNSLCMKYHGRILLCNPNFILDTFNRNPGNVAYMGHFLN